MKASIQGKDNVIKKLRTQISQLKETRSEADRTHDFRTLDFQITQLTEKVTVLREQNELFRAENEKVKKHYKELYDSIKITRAKHIEQTTTLLTENENLKAQIHENLKCNTMEFEKPRVLALMFLKTLRCDVEEAKVESPLDSSLHSASLYYKHVVQIILWYLDSSCSKLYDGGSLTAQEFHEKVHFGAIMGYEDYVIGDNVISRVYYVEGLRHNLFSVRQFCDSGLEVSFRNDEVLSHLPLGKSKKHTHKPKTENTNLEVLNTLHMDLCGPMPVQTINGKKYILVIVDDYSRFTWVKFLRSKDETSEVVIKFLKQIQVGLNKTIRYIRTDNGTKFVNKYLTAYYERVGIFHQKIVLRTPQQNNVVKRRNRTLVEAARIMLRFSKAPMFLWAKAVATACYTQNRSLIQTLHHKTPYELVHDKKPDLTFFRVFGALCYPTNDSEDLGKLQPTADIGIFVGYAPSKKGTRSYFSDAWTDKFNLVPAAPYVPPTNKELDILFQPMFDEYLESTRAERPVSPALAVSILVTSASTPSSTTIDQDAPSSMYSPQIFGITISKFTSRLLKHHPTVVIKFLKQIQVGLNKTVRFIRTDNGTEFVNKTLYDYYESVGIFHQKTVPRTPQQNGVVERRNRTLVEAARTMLIFSKAPMFLWAEAVATACYTQNRSLIHTRHDKTPYELVHNKKPDLTFFWVFGALCYPTNDSENLGKLQPRADIGIFIGYAPSRKGYRIYNKRTRQIMETIHVQFDELTEQMAPVQSSPGPAPNLLTPGPISLGLVPNPAPVLPYVPPTNKELEMLFQPMFDEYFNPLGNRQDPLPSVAQDPVIPTGPSVSISIDLDAPSGSHISSQLDHHSSSVHHGVAGEQYAEVNPFAAADHEPFVNVFAPDPTSKASSSREIMMPELNQSTQPHEHIRKWTDYYPLDNIIGNPSKPVSTQKQLATDALWQCHDTASQWINKVNCDEYGDVMINKARLVAKGFRQGIRYQSRPTKKHLEALNGFLSRYPPRNHQYGLIVIPGHPKKHLAASISSTEAEYIAIDQLADIFTRPAQKNDSNSFLQGLHEVGFNLLVHSFRALSTLRRSGLRMASATAKPCQGDSSEVYLITGRIPTVAAAGQRHVNSQPHAHTSYF
ncbi:retrovirus-related pol polyprotein from transposon TNT 1-94 [Tanacetum coccineum]